MTVSVLFADDNFMLSEMTNDDFRRFIREVISRCGTTEENLFLRTPTRTVRRFNTTMILAIDNEVGEQLETYQFEGDYPDLVFRKLFPKFELVDELSVRMHGMRHFLCLAEDIFNPRPKLDSRSQRRLSRMLTDTPYGQGMRQIIFAIMFELKTDLPDWLIHRAE